MPEFLVNFWRRQPFVCVCIGICLISLGGIWWVARQIESYEAELDRLTNQGTEVLNLVATRGVMESELELVQAAVRRTEDNLVIEDNLAENLWYFYSVEGRTQTRLTELRQLDVPNPGKDDTYLRVPYELSAGGDFVGISELLRQLEIGPRLMRVKDFSIRREANGDELLSLDLSIELLGRK